jgi:DNA-binding LytR/AlgR family response regulator
MKVLICDDDQDYALKCKKRIKLLAKEQEIDVIVDIEENGRKLLDLYDSKYYEYDLIYLNYYMPGINGLDTAKELRRREYNGDIVLDSTDESNIIEGYDVDALYYIIKGKTSEEQFKHVFMKAINHFKKRENEIMTFFHKNNSREIPIDNILYFHVQDHIVTVHYLNERIEEFKFYSTLSQIEQELSNNNFLRIHKSYLVSEKYISKKKSQVIELTNGDVIPIGRRFKNINK